MSRSIHVVVMEGGFSSEREISLKTAKGVKEALKEKKFRVTSFDVRDPELKGFDPDGIDVAFVALHGTFGEDGGIQTLLEKWGLPYTGSGPEASRLAMDKVAAKECFRGCGLRVASQVVLPTGGGLLQARRAAGLLGLPLVVKPVAEGSSVGISLVRDPQEFEKAIRHAAPYGRVMLEKFIPGIELTVGVLGQKVLPAIEIRPRAEDGAKELFDLAAKYGGHSEYLFDTLPAPVAARVEKVAWAAHQSLGCRDVSRVDMRLEEGAREPAVLEVNTIPGMTPTSLLPKAAKKVGLSYADVCAQLVALALERFRWPRRTPAAVEFSAPRKRLSLSLKPS